jgi:transcriptional regulator with XRE-family HTH domain
MRNDSRESTSDAPGAVATDAGILALRDALERAGGEAPAGRAARKAGRVDASVAADLARIAQRVRCWREEAGLTLQELARRSRVAASTIQKVETRQMVPTVTVLLKIARGLDRSPGELVHEAADELQVVFARSEERHRIRLREHMVCERLVGELAEPALEAWRVTHQPGSGSGQGLIRHEGETLVIGEAGAITFRVGERSYVVRAGDILHFKCTLPHSWRNEGREPATFVTVGTLPRALRRALFEAGRSASAGNGRGDGDDALD